MRLEGCKGLVLDGIGKPGLPVEIVEIVHRQPGQLVAEHFALGRVGCIGRRLLPGCVSWTGEQYEAPAAALQHFGSEHVRNQACRNMRPISLPDRL